MRTPEQIAERIVHLGRGSPVSINPKWIVLTRRLYGVDVGYYFVSRTGRPQRRTLCRVKHGVSPDARGALFISPAEQDVLGARL